MAIVAALETSRLRLRAIREADEPALQRNFADAAVIGELGAGVPWPYPPDGARTFIADHVLGAGADRWLWGLFLKTEDAELIGVIDLWRQGKPEHRGFWLARAHWGKGLMTEATAAVNDHAFDRLGFERLILANAVGNLRSRRIKEKSGAVLLRVEPARFVSSGYAEREVWELTKENWRTKLIPPGRV